MHAESEYNISFHVKRLELGLKNPTCWKYTANQAFLRQKWFRTLWNWTKSILCPTSSGASEQCKRTNECIAAARAREANKRADKWITLGCWTPPFKSSFNFYFASQFCSLYGICLSLQQNWFSLLLSIMGEDKIDKKWGKKRQKCWKSWAMISNIAYTNSKLNERK